MEGHYSHNVLNLSLNLPWKINLHILFDIPQMWLEFLPFRYLFLGEKN